MMNYFPCTTCDIIILMITDSNGALIVKGQGTYNIVILWNWYIFFFFQQKKEGKDLEFRELVEMTIQHLVSEL